MSEMERKKGSYSVHCRPPSLEDIGRRSVSPSLRPWCFDSPLRLSISRRTESGGIPVRVVQPIDSPKANIVVVDTF